jgi:hypothetical protein
MEEKVVRIPDPRVNFAISTRGSKPGLDQLGIQVDSAEELVEMKAAAQNADMSMLYEGEATSCYACSDMHWITGPQSVAWELFHTPDDIGTRRCCGGEAPSET